MAIAKTLNIIIQPKKLWSETSINPELSSGASHETNTSSIIVLLSLLLLQILTSYMII